MRRYSILGGRGTFIQSALLSPGWTLLRRVAIQGGQTFGFATFDVEREGTSNLKLRAHAHLTSVQFCKLLGYEEAQARSLVMLSQSASAFVIIPGRRGHGLRLILYGSCEKPARASRTTQLVHWAINLCQCPVLRSADTRNLRFPIQFPILGRVARPPARNRLYPSTPVTAIWWMR